LHARMQQLKEWLGQREEHLYTPKKNLFTNQKIRGLLRSAVCCGTACKTGCVTGGRRWSETSQKYMPSKNPKMGGMGGQKEKGIK